MCSPDKMTPSQRHRFALRTVARVEFTMTRGDVRVALASMGFDTCEENVKAFAAAWRGTIESAVHGTAGGSWGGHEGMTARYLIEEGKLPLTREAWANLYDQDTQPSKTLIGKYLDGRPAPNASEDIS